ncbi:hypothetical protein [Mycobacterium dioxanotrophicus]|uniref:hypothetical protein n=1 Tax=Mycobacterium dioxanotrophicus TaxID=482462 RepID=UPI0012FA2F63|nr:hypothetical protein [Mycobacterium dioxanotrophicus]
MKFPLAAVPLLEWPTTTTVLPTPSLAVAVLSAPIAIAPLAPLLDAWAEPLENPTPPTETLTLGVALWTAFSTEF